MNELPDYSICIVSHNTWELLKNCLNSLFEQKSSYRFEVLIVDNGSEDGTPHKIVEEYTQVKLICNVKNEGYTLPMNQALRNATGRYLVQLNPDTLVNLDTFETLITFMDSHPEVGICTPKVLNRDGTLQKQCRRSAARPWDAFSYITGLSKIFPDSQFFSRYLMTYLPEDEVNEVEAVSGSCMVIRRAVVEGVGYLDEIYFAYQEDADFCFRARQAGWKIIYYPIASIIHFGGQGGSRVQPYRGVLHWHRSYFLYYRKNLAKDYFFLLNWLIYLAIGFKLFVSLAATLVRKEKIVGTPKP